MRVLIMAGGTGGHIFPALAVGLRLRSEGHIIEWLGSRYGMEGAVCMQNDIAINYINVVGLRRNGLLRKLVAPFKLSFALLQSIFIILRFKPDVVLGMGGYVTGPAGFAAWLLRKKLVIHEQNAAAGLTNKMLSRFSDTVMMGFNDSFPAKVKAKFTGNPIREDFLQLPAPNERRTESSPELKILVIGGSAGARALNNLMPQLVAAWPDAQTLAIWHQVGKKNVQDALNAYRDSNITVNSKDSKIKLVDFIDDMAQAFCWADIVICRAGALTVAEIAAVGVASILIPYPYAVDDHQTKNASVLANNDAAIIMQQNSLELNTLLSILLDLAKNKDKLQAMAINARKLAKLDALDTVVSNIKQCVE